MCSTALMRTRLITDIDKTRLDFPMNKLAKHKRRKRPLIARWNFVVRNGSAILGIAFPSAS